MLKILGAACQPVNAILNKSRSCRHVYLAVEKQSAAVVAHTPVHGWQANVAEHSVREVGAEKVGERLRTVKQSVRL